MATNAPSPNSPVTVWVLFVSACASSLFAIRIWDWDDWWHLATGRWIVRNGAIPSVDPFSYTANGQRWPAIPWLADLTLYGFYWLGGAPGVVFCQVLCAFATLTIVGLTLRELGIDRRLVIAQILLTAVLVQERYARARPETIAAVLLAVALLVLVRWWQRRDRSLLVMAPLALLWIPTHASSPLTIVLSCVAVLIATTSPERKSLLATPLATLFLVVIAFVATRTGREVIDLAQRATRSGSPVAIGITDEWRAPTFADGSIWIPLALTLSAMVYCAARRRTGGLPLVVALIGLVLAARSIRHIAPAVLLTAPAWGVAGQALLNSLRGRSFRLGAGALPWMLGLGLPMAHVGLAPFERNRISFGFGVVEERFPSESVNVLETFPHGRVIHDMHFGGYLIWREIPGGVFWDGRTVGLYSDEQIVNIFLPASQDEDALERIANRFDTRYGLADPGLPLGTVMMTSNMWIPVHHGKTATVFVRRKHASDLVRAGVPLLNTLRISSSPSWNEQWYSSVLSTPVGQQDLVRSIGHQSRQSSASPYFLSILRLLSAEHPTFYTRLPHALRAEFPDVTLPD